MTKLSENNPSGQPLGFPLNDQLGLAPERAAFEAWARSKKCPPELLEIGGDYGGRGLVAGQWAAWKAAWDSQQARIDALMLEHCPDEMTPEQMAEWSKHQVAAPGFDEAALDAALKA